MSGSDAGGPVADFEVARAEFATELRALYDAYGGLSVRKVQSLLASRGHKVSISWISDALKGKYTSEDHTIALVLLLTSKPETADPEAENRWRRRCQNLERMQRTARAARRNNPPPPDDDIITELTELRTLRVRQDAQIKHLDNQVTDLIQQVEELSSRAVSEKERAINLQQAVYARWPSTGVRLEAPYGVSSVAFSPDGRVLAAGYRNGLLRTWDPDSGERIDDAVASHDSPVRCVAYSDDGSVLVTGGRDGTVRLADPQTAQRLGEPLAMLKFSVLAVAFSPRRQHRQGLSGWQYSLAVGDREGTVRVWTFSDVPSGEAAFTFAVDGPVQALAFVPDCDALAVATEFGRVTVRRYGEFAAREEAVVFSHAEDAAVRSLTFASDNGVLVVGDAAGRVHLLTLAAGDPLRVEQRGKFDVGFEVQSVVSCPGSPLLAIAGARGVVLRESSAGASTGPSIDGEVRSVAFRPDGKLIAVGMADGSTQLHLVAHARSPVVHQGPTDRKRWWRL